MQFFVFEMKHIKDKMCSRDHLEAARRHKINRMMCIGVIACSVVLASIPEVLINLIKMY